VGGAVIGPSPRRLEEEDRNLQTGFALKVFGNVQITEDLEVLGEIIGGMIGTLPPAPGPIDIDITAIINRLSSLDSITLNQINARTIIVAEDVLVHNSEIVATTTEVQSMAVGEIDAGVVLNIIEGADTVNLNQINARTIIASSTIGVEFITAEGTTATATVLTTEDDVAMLSDIPDVVAIPEASVSSAATSTCGCTSELDTVNDRITSLGGRVTDLEDAECDCTGVEGMFVCDLVR
jgi:hypothetical protein